MKEGTMPSLPLLAGPLDSTMAILVCKVLVPPGFKKTCNNVSSMGRETNHTTSLAAGVCPHFLVHTHRG